jgi:hypothetical protein
MYLVDTWESPDLGFRFRWEVGTYFNRLSVRRCLTCTQLHLEHRNVAGRDIDMWQYRAQTSCACIQSLNRRVSLHTHTHTLTHLHTHTHTHTSLERPFNATSQNASFRIDCGTRWGAHEMRAGNRSVSSTTLAHHACKCVRRRI